MHSKVGPWIGSHKFWIHPFLEFLRAGEGCFCEFHQRMLFSFALPQLHSGLTMSKLCLNLCSFNELNFKLNFVVNLTSSISYMLHTEFSVGSISERSFRLNSAIDLQLLIVSGKNFSHFLRVWPKFQKVYSAKFREMWISWNLNVAKFPNI